MLFVVVHHAWTMVVNDVIVNNPVFIISDIRFKKGSNSLPLRCKSQALMWNRKLLLGQPNTHKHTIMGAIIWDKKYSVYWGLFMLFVHYFGIIEMICRSQTLIFYIFISKRYLIAQLWGIAKRKKLKICEPIVFFQSSICAFFKMKILR